VKGQYYFVPEDTEPFEESYLFSRNWLDTTKDPLPEFGEKQDAKQTWTSGYSPLGGCFNNTDQCSQWNPSPKVWRWPFLGVTADDPIRGIVPVTPGTPGVQWTSACNWTDGTGMSWVFTVLNWRMRWNFPAWGQGWVLRLGTVTSSTLLLQYQADGSKWSNFGPNKMDLITDNTGTGTAPAQIVVSAEQ
jgi:hypothetical protein